MDTDTDTGLDRPMIKNIYKNYKNKKGKALGREQIGVMVAGTTDEDPESVTFGFSLCHIKHDRFDWIPNAGGGASRQKHFGRELAMTRAIKWGKKNTNQFIPYKIRDEAAAFINRAKRYYKDRTIMPWIEASISPPVLNADQVMEALPGD